MDKIDHPGKRFFFSDRQLQNQGVGVKPGAHHVNGSEKIGADTIQLVHESDFGYVVFIRLAPHGFGLRLYAADRAKNPDRPIQNPQGPLDLYGEIHMARRINQMNIACLSSDRWLPPM